MIKFNLSDRWWGLIKGVMILNLMRKRKDFINENC